MGPAFENLASALRTAESLSTNSKDGLYSERCLALAYQRLGDYYTYLAAQTPRTRRAAHSTAADAWYDKALSIWSRWRTQNLAVPYSTNREKEILRVKSSSAPSTSKS
jgi:hypothetical protein